MVEVMKIMLTSLKRSHACTAALSTPNPAAGHQRPTAPLETPEHSRPSLCQSLVWSLLFSPGSWCTRFTCALQKSISQSYVNSGCSMVGLMVTSPKRTYAIVTARARLLPTCTSTGDTQTQFCLSLCGVSRSWCTQGMFEPSDRLWQVCGLILNVISSPLPSFWGFSFALGCGISPHSHSSTCCLTGVSLTLDVAYLLRATTPDLGCGVSPLGHSSTVQPVLATILQFLSSSGPSDSPPPPAPCLINTCSTLKTLKVIPQPLSSA